MGMFFSVDKNAFRQVYKRDLAVLNNIKSCTAFWKVSPFSKMSPDEISVTRKIFFPYMNVTFLPIGINYVVSTTFRVWPEYLSMKHNLKFAALTCHVLSENLGW